MQKSKRSTGSSETRESLFELQIDAFLDGLSDHEPVADDYGVSDERAQEIIGESMMRNLIDIEL